jgi:PmbA protein
MQEILKKAKSYADSAEVFRMSDEATPVNFEAGKLKAIESKYSDGYALRVISGGRSGFAASSGPKNAAELCEKAKASATLGDKANMRFPDSAPDGDYKIYDQAVADLSVEKMVELGHEAIGQLLEFDKDLKVDLDLEKEVSDVYLANSNGFDGHYRGTGFGFSISAFTIVDNSFLSVYDGYGHTLLNTEEILKSVAGIRDRLEKARKVVTVKSGTLPILFAPMALPSLMMALKMGTNGRSLQKGATPLVGREGEKILHESITITDDGCAPSLPASAPFDGDGTAKQKTILFEKGVLKNFIYDLETAGRMNKKSTGNASRSLASIPVPDNNNFIIQPGDKPLAEIIKGMDRGIIVDQVLGGGQSNLIAGDFSVNLDLAFYVENGEIQGRVKDAMVAGNVYEAFANVLAISSEQKLLGPNLFPHILVDGIPVVSK